MKKINYIYILSVLSLLILSFSSNTVSAESNLTIREIFPDSNVAQEVAKKAKKSLDSSLTNDDLKKIVYINLTNKDIENLKGIGHLKYLKNLSFGSNPKITEIPEEVLSLKHLETLYFQLTSVKHLPKDIDKLLNLKNLSIGNTLIETIPASIGNLENLEEFSVANLMLKELPDSIIDLKKLNTFIAPFNSFENLSMEQVSFLKEINDLRIPNQFIISKSPYSVLAGEKLIIDSNTTLDRVAENLDIYNQVAANIMPLSRYDDFKNYASNGTLLSVENAYGNRLSFNNGKISFDTKNLNISEGKQTLELFFNNDKKNHSFTYIAEIYFKSNVTVEYLDENGKELLESTTLTNLVGEQIDIVPLKIDGYTLQSNIDDLGQFESKNRIIQLVYKSLNNSVSDPTEGLNDDSSASITDNEEIPKNNDTDASIANNEEILKTNDSEKKSDVLPSTGIANMKHIIALTSIPLGLFLVKISKINREDDF